MQTSLRAISNKAKDHPGHRFQNLFGLLNTPNLIDCYHRLRRNAAPGADGVDVDLYGQALIYNVEDLVHRLKSGSYRAKLIKRVYIPKANGKLRPLGLPATEDKLLQMAAARVLQAVFEPVFLSYSYGYRPGVGAHHAVEYLKKALRTRGIHWVVEADIKGFFDNIDHEWLLRMLRLHIDDEAFIALIRKWLKAGVLDIPGQILHPEQGSPQGGVISPILANIYLHYVLDLWFEKVVRKHSRRRAILIRYADDFVVGFYDLTDARRFFKVLGKRLAKFGLQLAQDKTRLLRFGKNGGSLNQSFDFLGFTFRWERSRKGLPIVSAIMSKKNFHAALRRLKDWLKANRFLKLPILMAALGLKLRGLYRYYGLYRNFSRLETLAHHLKWMLFKWLNRRSQRRSYTLKRFFSMLTRHPLPRPRLIKNLSPRRPYVPA